MFEEVLVKRDVIVIGVGAAGRSAALEAASCGLSVLLVGGGEADVRSAESALHMRRVRAAIEIGATPRAATSFSETDRSRAADSSRLDLRDDLVRSCRCHPSIDVELGGVELTAPRVIRMRNGSTCEASMLVIAVGGRPRRPERFAFDDLRVCDVESFWRRGSLPRSAVVLGADAEGWSLASLLATLRVPVTVVDRRSRSLRYVDRDVLERFHACMRAMNVDLVLSEEVMRVEREADERGQVLVHLASGRVEVGGALVVVGGRESGVRELRLERQSIDVDSDGFVLADERGRTSQPGVFAAGSAVSAAGPHSDEYCGRAVVRMAMGLTDGGSSAPPLIVESLPEIAMVGLTSEMCDRLDLPHIARSASLGALEASVGSASAPGMLKLVVHRDNRTLLGVQVIGSRAAELVQLGALLVSKERSVRELLNLAPPEESPFAAYASVARDVLCAALAETESRSPSSASEPIGPAALARDPS
jgi:NAD(P) transhydrogenase